MAMARQPLPETLDELRSFAASLQTELYAKTLHIEKLKIGQPPILGPAFNSVFCVQGMKDGAVA